VADEDQVICDARNVLRLRLIGYSDSAAPMREPVLEPSLEGTSGCVRPADERLGGTATTILVRWATAAVQTPVQSKSPSLAVPTTTMKSLPTLCLALLTAPIGTQELGRRSLSQYTVAPSPR